MIEVVSRSDDAVTVSVGGHELSLTHRWIRDHSEDPTSLEPTTLQREVDTFALPSDLAAADVAVEGDELVVRWVDHPEPSRCSERLLRVMAGVEGVLIASPWASGSAFDPTRHECADVMSDDRALLSVLDAIVSDGTAVLSGIEPTEAAATALAERVGRVRHTVFGSMWRVASDVVDHLDSAYATTYLEPHTDATYMTDAPGTQLFCCVERSGTGGESILVDGFAAAEDLRRDAPEHFETLTTVVVPARYVEPGVHLRAERPAIRLGPDGTIRQVSFNNYDRAPFWLPEPRMSAFYEAYAALHDLITDESRWFVLRLEPGDAVLFDNWRVLHGRNGYTGSRAFHGCYHDRDEILSRRRVLAASAS
ncbi:MAG: TauD/TfdA family dioxygenase [Actinomycetota bacterium]